MESYYIFVLHHILKVFFGDHYPTEIIELIIMSVYKPFKICAGWHHTTLQSDYSYVWGNNYYCQLGLNSIETILSPHKLILHGEQSIKSFACGFGHTIAITYTNKIYVWGNNVDGQLGLGHCQDQPLPTELILKFVEVEVETVSCGDDHTIALTKLNKVYGWGRNYVGELGLGDQVPKSTPHEITLPDDIGSICCGDHHTIVLSKLNKIYVWGYNYYGQLGVGDNRNRDTPTELMLLDVESVKCGADYTLCLTKFGDAYIWGDQAGLCSTNNNTPQKIFLSHIKSISCGGYHTIAITKSNKLYSWGNNSEGQLGLGNDTNQYDIQEISLSDVVSVECGGSYSIAVTKSNKIYVWGQNNRGQLGLGDTTNRHLPHELVFRF